MTELTGIGAELRRAREAQGLTIIDVAQQLKFAPRQIESLEDERFERLPGATIARGMVRNYARLLGLDPEPLVARMAAKAVQAAPSGGEPALKPTVPFSDGGRRSTLVYVAFSIAVLALAAVVAYEWQHERAAPQFVAPVQPQRSPEPAAAAPAPEPVAERVAEAPKPEPNKAPEAKPVEKKAVDNKAMAVDSKAAESSPSPAEPARTASGNPHRIEFTCQEESWIEVKDGTGRSLVSSLNPAGCQRLVRGRGPFEIIIGNANGVTLTVDGKVVDLKPHTRGERARVTFE